MRKNFHAKKKKKNRKNREREKNPDEKQPLDAAIQDALNLPRTCTGYRKTSSSRPANVSPVQRNVFNHNVAAI